MSQPGQERSDPIARRRVKVGAISIVVALIAMALLISQRDRIRTLGPERACRQGDAQACLRLERMYRIGERVNQNDETADMFHQLAVAIFRRECEGADRDACYRLGVALTDTVPRLRDVDAARAAFERACEAGLERACDR